MYGTETPNMSIVTIYVFENDVKMYGTETGRKNCKCASWFENDVKMYGTETESVVQHTE